MSLKLSKVNLLLNNLELLRKTKKNKTAGLDEIPAEVWKTGHFNHILLELCDDVYILLHTSIYTLRNQLNTG